MKIAVLLTTFNRKNKTVICLESLKRQKLPDDVKIELFVTDDASTDGSVDAIKECFPNANIFNGGGSLFWAGGMRNSWREATKHFPDYYLLLNDDTVLHDSAISVLLKGSNNASAVCIGSTKDPATGKRSYGGRCLTAKNRWKDDLIV